MEGGRFKVLDLVRPFLPFVPEVVPPRRSLRRHEKMIYTVIVFFIFLLCSNMPLYGIQSTTGSDPLRRVRALLASNRGSLMELGITPITLSGFLVQILSIFLFQVDFNVREDRMLLRAAQKLLGFLVTIGMASAYVLSGMYGNIALLGVGNAILLVLQLSFAGVMVTCLEELFQKGYGFGSAISLFITSNFCANFFWKAFSPMTINIGRGDRFEGAVVALIHLLISRSNKSKALHEAFCREELPNMTNILATVLISLMVIYLQGFSLNIPVKCKSKPGLLGRFPIKLFYTNTMPIVLQSALFSCLFTFSLRLYRMLGGNFLVDMIGKWDLSADSKYYMPVGGMIYYLTPPSSLADMAANPFHAFFYTVAMLSACVILSKQWLEVSGSSAIVVKEMRAEGIEIAGDRECTIEEELDRNIPTAAALGGLSLGILTILAETMGAIGSVIGILLPVSTIHQYYESYEREKHCDYETLEREKQRDNEAFEREKQR